LPSLLSSSEESFKTYTIKILKTRQIILPGFCLFLVVLFIWAFFSIVLITDLVPLAVMPLRMFNLTHLVGTFTVFGFCHD